MSNLLSKKLAVAALAGLLAAGTMTVSGAVLAEEHGDKAAAEKAACKGKDAKEEKAKCKGEGKEEHKDDKKEEGKKDEKAAH